MDDTKARENRLRRKALRQGLWLRKSRRRDPCALDYGKWSVCDAETGRALNAAIYAGFPTDHALDLDEVEEWLA